MHISTVYRAEWAVLAAVIRSGDFTSPKKRPKKRSRRGTALARRGDPRASAGLAHPNRAQHRHRPDSSEEGPRRTKLTTYAADLDETAAEPAAMR